jgi:hypothetical protein
MPSSGKRKTTMAKLTRERRLMERRLDKQAKKLARKQSATGELVQDNDTTSTVDQIPQDMVDGDGPQGVTPRIA